MFSMISDQRHLLFQYFDTWRQKKKRVMAVLFTNRTKLMHQITKILCCTNTFETDSGHLLTLFLLLFLFSDQIAHSDVVK